MDVVAGREKNGVKFPRGIRVAPQASLILIGMSDYLQPEIEVVSDERVAFMDSATASLRTGQ